MPIRENAIKKERDDAENKKNKEILSSLEEKYSKELKITNNLENEVNLFKKITNEFNEDTQINNNFL